MEFMDGTTIGTIEEYLHLGLPTDAAAILIIEADGGDEATVGGISRRSGGCAARAVRPRFGSLPLKRSGMTCGGAGGRCRPLWHGAVPTNWVRTSACRGRIPEAIRRIRRSGPRAVFPLLSLGMQATGICTPTYCMTSETRRVGRVEEASRDIFGYRSRTGGHLSGEHGVGLLKLPYLPLAVGSLEIGLMQGIEKVFDPKGILNPAKSCQILDDSANSCYTTLCNMVSPDATARICLK